MIGKQEQIIQTRSMLLSWFLRRTTYGVVGVSYLFGLFLVQRTLVSLLLLTGICGAWLLIYRTGRRRSPLYRVFALFCLACASLFIPEPPTNVFWHSILPITTACVMMTIRPRSLGLLAAGTLWLSTSLMISLLLRQWDMGVQAMLLVSFSSACGWTATINELAVAHMQLQEAHTQLQEYSAQVEELSIMRERNRIAREIHDTLGHALTLLAVQLETATQLEVRSDPRLHEKLLEARRVAKACLTDVRHSVQALRPDAASTGSLQEQLRRLVAEFETTYPETRITLDLEEATHPLSPEVHQTLYRCAQEALTNIRKHAHATKVLLRLSTSEEQVELTVLDNGQGNKSSRECGTPSFGLRGMRERVAPLDGALRTGPEAGHGWRVEVMLPLTPQGQAGDSEPHSRATREKVNP